MLEYMDPGALMPSVVQSTRSAIHHTERILFSPFEIQRWFALGFTAFLASLGGGFRMHSNGLPKEWPALGEWIQAHLPLAIALGIALLLLVLAVLVVLNWIACRGQFMFLDNVIHNRTAIREPWQRFRQPANQLFVFQLILGAGILVGLLLLVGIGAGGAIFLRPVFEQLGHAGRITAIAVLVVAALALFLGLIFFALVLQDFLVPLVYLKNLKPTDALRAFLRDLLPGHGWDLCRFYLMKLLLGLGALIVIVVGGCLTCCIGFLPYLSSVLTLPITVMFTCLNLDFLAQMDPSLEAFPVQETQPCAGDTQA
ncbi:MAG: hypothetical protein WAT51_10620 [Holophaga sp.]